MGLKPAAVDRLKLLIKSLNLIKRAFGNRAPEADCSRMQSVQLLSDADFLALFKIGEVSSALEKGDISRAKDELVDHYSRKINKGWYEFPGVLGEISKLLETKSLSGAESSFGGDSIFENCIGWFGFPDMNQDTMEKLLVWANLILQNRVVLGGLSEVAFGKDIKWDYKHNSDKQWAWTLNRHEWIALLFYVFMQNGDQRYAEKAVELILDWQSKNPPPLKMDEESPAWRLMEVGMRMYLSWIPGFGVLFKLPSLKREAILKMLRGICDHARFLSLFKTRKNHLIRESIGLAYVGVCFSEFKEAEQWRQIAFARLEQELSKQFNSDGSHIEMSTAYQWLVTIEYQCLYDLLESTRKSLPNEDLRVWLEKMYHFIGYLIRPNFTFPLLGDGFTDPNYILLHKLAQAGKNFKRDDLLYIGTEGRDGVSPRQKSVCFNNGGFYVMRSDWTKNARYMLLDAGPYGGFHGHEDKLNLEVYAFGQLFIADPGTYTYKVEDPFRKYFVSSLSHNVILVDGKSQIRRWDKNSMDPKPNKSDHGYWVSTSDYDYVVSAYQNGFSNFSFIPPKEPAIEYVTHKRNILFVKAEYWLIIDELQADAFHRYDLLFHAVPGIEAINMNDKRVCLASSAASSTLELIPAEPDKVKVTFDTGCEKPIKGWHASSIYHSKTPSTTVTFSFESAGSTKIATLIYPSPIRTQAGVATIKPLEVFDKKAMAYAVKTLRGIDHLMISNTDDSINNLIISYQTV